MIQGQTNGSKSSEFKWLIGFSILGLILMAVEIISFLTTGKSLGIDVQMIFYSLFGSGSVYAGSRTIVKNKTIDGINTSQKIDAELEKARNVSNNIDDSSYLPDFPDDFKDDAGPDEITTKLPLDFKFN